LRTVKGGGEVKSFALNVEEVDQFRGSLEEEHFGAFGGLAKLALLEVWARGVLPSLVYPKMLGMPIPWWSRKCKPYSVGRKGTKRIESLKV